MEATSSIESRLYAIEAELGIVGGKVVSRKENKKKGCVQNVSIRLDELQKGYNTRTSRQFRDVCNESKKLFHELNAGSILTYQTKSTSQQQSGSINSITAGSIVSSSAPVYYRRQEILASAETMHNDMKELEQMIPLLLVGTSHSGDKGTGIITTGFNSTNSTPSKQSTRRPTGSGSASADCSNLLREDQVINAPIITKTSIPIHLEDQKRLEALKISIHDLQTRSANIENRLDSLLQLYYSLITTINNKIVLANEEKNGDAME